MKKILVVDDNVSTLTMVSMLLRHSYKVYSVDSGSAALKFLKKQQPDLILLDVQMPEMNGTELMRILKSDSRLSNIPVIFLTALNDTDNETTALELGAVDYIHKPINTAVLMSRVKLHLELELYRKNLEDLVRVRTHEVELLQKVTIDLLAHVTEFRDEYTGNHIKRTIEYVCALMKNLTGNIPESYQVSQKYHEDICKSTPLHDIGKIGIPDAILVKPDRLTNEEFTIMKSHVESGARLLQQAIDELRIPSFLDVALEMTLTHHEKWDGTGYPQNLAGENIPISGRVMAIADVYDALTSKRPYKEPFSHEKAMEIMAEGKSRHFDPVLLDIFINIQDEIVSIAEKYRRNHVDE